MTVDEAIERYKSITEEHMFVHDIDGHLDVVQLIEWLRQARGADAAARWYTKKIRELESDRERMFKANVEKNNEVLRLLVENSKLRELCKRLYRLADESYVPFKDVNPWMNEFDNAIRTMRELGIEVD